MDATLAHGGFFVPAHEKPISPRVGILGANGRGALRLGPRLAHSPNPPGPIASSRPVPVIHCPPAPPRTPGLFGFFPPPPAEAGGPFPPCLTPTSRSTATCRRCANRAMTACHAGWASSSCHRDAWSVLTGA